MNPKKAAFLIILISLLFAAAIILSSMYIDDKGSAQTVTFLLIGLWWIPFSYLAAAAGKRSLKSDFRCMKQKVAGFFTNR